MTSEDTTTNQGSRYERTFGTDWDSLDENEAIERAYALGVAASLGEYHPEELDDIRETVETRYNQSVVDLAFEEGRNEGREVVDSSSSEDTSVWRELIDEELVTIDDDRLAGGRTGLPSAVERTGALDRQTLDSTGATDFPEFLKKE